MWIKKTQIEIASERHTRYKKTRFVFYFIELLILYYIAKKYSESDGFISLFKNDPEILILFLFPLLIYFTYTNYVLTGSLAFERASMMCLHCHKGMGRGDDGWGFKVYGKKKPKWYQIRACKTPEKCEIVYMYQVKLVMKEEKNDN